MAGPEPRTPSTATVLVADGEVLVRHALADYLRRCGYEVIEAASSDEALTVLAEPGLAIGAVICDVTIGGSLSGFALAAWARASRPGLQVLLAGNVEKAADAAAGLCDEGPALARPYDPQLVVDRIKRLLATRDRQG